jgi:hypothetical protein
MQLTESNSVTEPCLAVRSRHCIERFGMRICLIILFLFSGDYVSANDCNQKALLSPQANRKAIIAEVKSKNIPAFLKMTPSGPLPVILVESDAFAKLSSLINSSIGIQILLQPNTNFTDHAMFRVGKTQIDWAMPETRAYFPGDPAELHGSGIAWRDIDAQLKDFAKRDRYSRVTIEVNYRVSPTEKMAVEYYHRVRRATLTSIQQTNSHGQLRPHVPGGLYTYEGCFQFCSGSMLSTLKDFLADKMKASGIQNINEFISKPEVQEVLARARNKIMTADVWDAKKFNYEIFSQFSLPNEILPTEADKEEFMNSLVAYDAVDRAIKVFTRLGIGREVTARENFSNPNVTAILIYTSPKEGERFRRATYTAPGFYRGSGWGKDPEGTLPFDDQYPIPK